MRPKGSSGSKVSVERDQRLSGAGKSRHSWYHVVQRADVRKLCFAAVEAVELAQASYDRSWPLPEVRRSAAYGGAADGFTHRSTAEIDPKHAFSIG